MIIKTRIKDAFLLGVFYFLVAFLWLIGWRYLGLRWEFMAAPVVFVMLGLSLCSKKIAKAIVEAIVGAIVGAIIEIAKFSKLGTGALIGTILGVIVGVFEETPIIHLLLDVGAIAGAIMIASVVAINGRANNAIFKVVSEPIFSATKASNVSIFLAIMGAGLGAIIGKFSASGCWRGKINKVDGIEAAIIVIGGAITGAIMLPVMVAINGFANDVIFNANGTLIFLAIIGVGLGVIAGLISSAIFDVGKIGTAFIATVGAITGAMAAINAYSNRATLDAIGKSITPLIFFPAVVGLGAILNLILLAIYILLVEGLLTSIILILVEKRKERQTENWGSFTMFNFLCFYSLLFGPLVFFVSFHFVRGIEFEFIQKSASWGIFYLASVITFPMLSVLNRVYIFLFSQLYLPLAYASTREKEQWSYVSSYPHVFCQFHFLRPSKKRKALFYYDLLCRGTDCNQEFLPGIQRATGFIGGDITDYKINGDRAYISLWFEDKKEARNADIDVLEIWESNDGLQYDWAINAVINKLKNDTSRPSNYLKKVPVIIIGNPPISQGSMKMLEAEFSKVRRFQKEIKGGI